MSNKIRSEKPVVGDPEIALVALQSLFKGLSVKEAYPIFGPSNTLIGVTLFTNQCKSVEIKAVTLVEKHPAIEATSTTKAIPAKPETRRPILQIKS